MHVDGEHQDGGIDLDAGAVLFDRERNHIEDVYFSRNSGQNGASSALCVCVRVCACECVTERLRLRTGGTGLCRETDVRVALCCTQELCSTWETA